MGGAEDGGFAGSWALVCLADRALALASAGRRHARRRPVALGAVLFVLVAGFLPAPAAAGTSLRQTDWAAVVAADPQITVETGPQCGFSVFPAPCISIEADTSIPSSGYPSQLGGYVATDRVLYGDLVGDGGEEAIVPISQWSQPGFEGSLVYRAGSDGPQLAASVAGYHLSLQIAAGALQVSRADDGGCIGSGTSCPSSVMTASYTLGNQGLVLAGQSEQPLAEYLNVPPEVLALLPAASDLRAGLAADLTGDGTVRWVLLYEAPSSIPNQPGITGVGGHLAVVGPAPGGWSIARDFPVALSPGPRGFLVSDTITLGTIAGTPAAILRGPLSARGTSGLVVVRWDGAGFQDVFHGINDGLGLNLADLGGDGNPVVVNPNLSGCSLMYDAGPYLLTVLRWDGTTFSDATGQYPALLSQDEADARTRLATEIPSLAQSGPASFQASQAPRLTACFHALLAVLAAKGGDMATAAAECNQAQVAEQDPDVLLQVMNGIPGAGELCMPDEGGSQ